MLDCTEFEWDVLTEFFRESSLHRNLILCIAADRSHILSAHLRELDPVMSKLKHEAELFKAALLAGIRYAEGRGAVQFEATDSASAKALYVYRLLVHDKLITPMPEDQVGEKTIRHRLTTWYAHLPKGHQLLE